MPTITVLANGAQFYVRDASPYANDSRFAVGDDQQPTTNSSTGGVAIDPTASQSQWLLNYLLNAKDRGIAQFGADTSRMGTLGNLAATQYGNETSRAGVVGNLYASLFGTPANYGAVSNFMRGQPNASGLSFWNALASRSHLGEGETDPRGRLHNIDPDKVIADLFGGVASSGKKKSSSSSSSGGATSYGSSNSNSSGGASVAHGAGSVPGPSGYAAGGGMVIEHPATLHLADGRVIPIGEYGRPEQLTVTPLATNPLPPRYYAGLMPGSQGMAAGGALTFGGGAPAVLYPGATVHTGASAPTDTGQVTSAGTHAGHTSTGPYYNRSPWNDPRYAQTRDIMDLSPLEKSLLESTTAAMGLPASEWWSIYQRSRPSFQQAATGLGFTRAA